MLSEAQASEIAKYGQTYAVPKYGMSAARCKEATIELEGIESRGSYLDVSTGRGEMLKVARLLGFEKVHGTEVVPRLLGPEVSYALAWDLPFEDGAFEVVSLFDVIEHILPGDDERVCLELARVASRVVLLTANNRPSNSLGMELHVNRRPYDDWDRLFKDWFPGDVAWRPHPGSVSETWRIDL